MCQGIPFSKNCSNFNFQNINFGIFILNCSTFVNPIMVWLYFIKGLQKVIMHERLFLDPLEILILNLRSFITARKKDGSSFAAETTNICYLLLVQFKNSCTPLSHKSSYTQAVHLEMPGKV